MMSNNRLDVMQKKLTLKQRLREVRQQIINLRIERDRLAAELNEYNRSTMTHKQLQSIKIARSTNPKITVK